MSSDDTISNEEWENRQLCSDGNCIGVIGPDGLCKECGKPGEKVAMPRRQAPPSSDTEAAPDDEPEAPDTMDAEASVGESAAELPEDDGDWANRRLCPDGNCIGVIGPDGKCKECGRSAE
jgi:hypothetical protein